MKITIRSEEINFMIFRYNGERDLLLTYLRVDTLLRMGMGIRPICSSKRPTYPEVLILEKYLRSCSHPPLVDNERETIFLPTVS